VAGLEALLALRDLTEGRTELTLAASAPDFSYKPLTVEEPFLQGVAARMELAPIAAELGARFVQQAVVAVRPDDHAVELADGSSLGFELGLERSRADRHHHHPRQPSRFPPDRPRWRAALARRWR